MIKVIMVDDEPLARNVLKEYLMPLSDFELVAECGDGFEAVKAIQQHHPDLVLLDIQMPKINGFETLELLERKPAVIFATAFDEYALKAFEQNAIDYLLKPFSQQRFNQAVQKFLELRSKGEESEQAEKLENIARKHVDEPNRVVVKNGSNILIIPTTEITHMEAYDDYVKIFTGETFYLKKKTMSYYEEVLDPENFVRVHRSFILNLDFLTRIEQADKTSHQALLKNGTKVPLSKSGYTRLRDQLNL